LEGGQSELSKNPHSLFSPGEISIDRIESKGRTRPSSKLKDPN